MDCDICREALSARSDGEAEPVPAQETDAHVRSCAACRRWEHDAAALTRRLRVRAVGDVPDLTARVLAVPRTTAPPAGVTHGWHPRAVLAGVGVAQLTLGLAQVLGVGGVDSHAGHGEVVSSAHLLNESTAWNLALGLGMLWTALRPRASAGLLPVMAGFLAVLTPFSAHDLITGTAPLSRITSHVLLVLGLVVLLAVHHTRGTPEDGGRTANGERSPDRADELDEEPHHSGPVVGTTGKWRHLRPVSRKRAA